MIQKVKYKWFVSWRDWLVVATAILVLASLVLIAFGISQNNKLAAQSKSHIDCIIKLSETPLGPQDRAKYIDNLNNTCQIKFTQ